MERREARGGALILGGGFAGSYVGRLLGRSGATILSLENHMLYTPLLPEAAAGTIEPRHVVVPPRQMCPHAELVLGEVTGLDREGRVALADTLAGPVEISYEQLVVALGAITRVFPVPGLHEHGLGFKDLADAIALRNRVLLQLERASIEPDPAELGFVFVGAGYAGVEALAELEDFARAALRFCPGLRGMPQRWVLVDAAPQILPEIPRRLGEYAARHLERRGVEIHVGTTLESFDGSKAILANGARIPARTLVWTTGVRPNPVLAELGLKGIAEVQGFSLRGFLGWWVARTYQLYQLPLLSRKLRVVTDWTVALVFRRDVAALSMLGHPRRLGE